MICPFVLLNEDVYESLVNDSHRESPKFLDRNLSQCYIFPLRFLHGLAQDRSQDSSVSDLQLIPLDTVWP